VAGTRPDRLPGARPGPTGPGDDHRQFRPRRHAWEEPGIALFLRTLASFARLIQFDRRGTGASDPLPLDSLPPWESYTQDLTAVLDEVGSQQAALLAQLDASPMALFFAGTRPDREVMRSPTAVRPSVPP